MCRSHLAVVTLSAVVATIAAAVAQQPPSVTPMTPEMNPTYAYTRPDADFVRKTVMIPMRDGKKLFTVIVMRKGENALTVIDRVKADVPQQLALSRRQRRQGHGAHTQPAHRRHPAADGR